MAAERLEEGFHRIRLGLTDGQAHVEALLALLRDRVAAEDAYSRALLRLSRQTLALDERVTEPAIFEALASLRGDLANESVQHSELGASVQRDVVDPLSRLREGGDAVQRQVTTQSRQAAADVKAATERCRRLYTKYQAQHVKAVQACLSAGVPAPVLLPPPTEGGSLKGAATAAPFSMSPSLGATLAPISSPPRAVRTTAASLVAAAADTLRPGGLTSSSSRVGLATCTVPSQSPQPPSASLFGEDKGGGAAPAAVDGGGAGSEGGTRPGFGFMSPAPTVTSGTLSASLSGGVVRLQIHGDGPAGSLAAAAAEAEEVRLQAPAGAGASGTPAGGLAKSRSFGEAHSSNAHSHIAAPESGIGRRERLNEEEDDDEIVSIDGAESVGAFESALAAPGTRPGGAHVYPGSALGGATRPSQAQTRRGSLGGGSEGGGSVSSFDPAVGAALGDFADHSLAGRIRSMASGLIGTMTVPPTTAAAAANANMTAAERIELARSLAAAAVQLADEAWADCLQGWAQLARAREATLRQFAASTVIFGEVERKRVAELSDSLRRYAVFISSMHANLQFDVQRLSAKLEDISRSPATTLTAIGALHTSEALAAALGPPIVAAAAAAAAAASSAAFAVGGGPAAAPGDGNGGRRLSALGDMGGGSLSSIATKLPAAPPAGYAASFATPQPVTPAALALVIPAASTSLLRANSFGVGGGEGSGLGGPISPSLSRLGSRVMGGMAQGMASLSVSASAASASLPAMGSMGSMGSSMSSGLNTYASSVAAFAGLAGYGSSAVVDGAGAGGSAGAPLSSSHDGAADAAAFVTSAALAGGLGVGAASAVATATAVALHQQAQMLAARAGTAAAGDGGALAVSSAAAGAAASAAAAGAPDKGGLGMGGLMSGVSSRFFGGGGGGSGAGSAGSTKPAASSPLAPRGIAFDGASFGIGGGPAPSKASVAVGFGGWSGNLGRLGAMLGGSSSSSSSSAAPSADASAPPPHPPRPGGKFSSSPFSQSGVAVPTSLSASVSVTGLVRNNGAVGAGTRGSSEAAAKAAQLRIPPGAIEYFVAALFDPHELRIKLAADGASLRDLAAVAAASSSSGGSSEEDIPSLSLADFALGIAPVSPQVGRSRVGTAASGGSPDPAFCLDPPPASSSSGSSGSGGVGGPGAAADEASFDFGAGAVPVLAPESGPASTPPPQPASIPQSPEAPRTPESAQRSKRQAAPLAAAAVQLQLSSAVAAGEMNPAVVALLPQVRRLLKGEPDGLSRFSMGMDARRGEGVALTRPCFDALASMMLIALDVAELRGSFGEARMLMVISQTLYCSVAQNEDASAVDPAVAAAMVAAGATPRPARERGADAAPLTPPAAGGGSAGGGGGAGGGRLVRLYLQMRVRHHSIWQLQSFWEQAIQDSIGSEMSKLGGGGGGGGGGGSGREQREREQELMLRQLSFFAYQMVGFGVSAEAVRRLLDKYARFVHLDVGHLAQLSSSLESFERDGHG